MGRSTFDSKGKREALPERMVSFFGPDGILSMSGGFEFRPQQQDMAKLVSEALTSSSSLIVEAGTGVGKSLAYLAPSVNFALENDRKAVISTHTINLQEQLVDKDLPLLSKLSENGFSVVLMKGRGNYLCPRRLRISLSNGSDLFDIDDLDELDAIRDWAEDTHDGTLSDMDFEPSMRVWSQVCSESHLCTPRTCGHDSTCFYQATRKQAVMADVVVINHTLLFTMMGANDGSDDIGEGFIFPEDFLIIDEAHTLENVAAKQLGLRVSRAGIRFDLNRLYDVKRKRGMFQTIRHADGVHCVTELNDAVSNFFGSVESSCEFNSWGNEYRVRRSAFVEDTLSEYFLEVEKNISIASEKVTNDSNRNEILELGRRMKEWRISINEFLEQSLDGHVYWVERSKGSGDNIVLNSAPSDVSDELNNLFFTKNNACVLTSATLSVGENKEPMGYFKNRVGAESVNSVRIGSPFDYEKQMRVYLVKSIQDPRSDGYEADLTRWIEHFVNKSKGRAFVLFTSYKLMNSVALKMDVKIKNIGYKLLVQGKKMPRNKLLNAFRQDSSSVLFGTDSFWAGVDVPGDALSNVIVTRLPFAVPDHPLTASRLEAIEASGGNSFLEYTVPEAILKLRQGVGRLIRSSSDQGIVVVLDNRILLKQYGKAFIRALPNAPIEIVED